MPIYEFVCNDCGHQFDVMMPMKDADVTPACKKCSNHNVSRLLSVFNSQSTSSCCGQSSSQSSSSCSGCSGGHCSTCH